MKDTGVFLRAVVVGAVVVAGLGAWQAQAGEGIVGSWLFKDEQKEVRVEFKADGSYSRSIRMPGTEGAEKGTYKAAGGVIEFHPEGKEEVERLKYQLPEADKLAVTDEDGAGIQFARVGGGGPQPPPADDLSGGTDGLEPALPLPAHAAGHIVYCRKRMVPMLPQIGGAPIPVRWLFVMNGDGTAQRRFLYPKGYVSVFDPAWSPDGKTLLFGSDFKQEVSAHWSDIFVVGADGTALRRVTGDSVNPPDAQGTGSITARVVDDTGTEPREVRIGWKGRQGRCVAADGGFQLTGVPAGTMLWVRVWRTMEVGALAAVHVPANRRAEVELRLSYGNNLVLRPGMTPDGRYVVGMGRRAHLSTRTLVLDHTQQWFRLNRHIYEGYQTVMVYDAATGTPLASHSSTEAGRDLMRGGVRLSPDGQWITYVAGRLYYPSLYVVPLDGLLKGAYQPRAFATAQTAIDPGTLVSANVGFSNPAWSPDGKRLAFVRSVYSIVASAPMGARQPLRGDIVVAGVDGSNPVQVTRLGANQLPADLCWSRDGRRIAFVALTCRRPVLDAEVDFNPLRPNYTADVWTVGADGSDLRQLTSTGDCEYPAWGP